MLRQKVKRVNATVKTPKGATEQRGERGRIDFCLQKPKEIFDSENKQVSAIRL
jgi:hypothetical protein